MDSSDFATLPWGQQQGSTQRDISGLSDVGKERERNEDQFLIATLQRTLEVRDTTLSADAQRFLPSSVEGTILMVADGMGGGAAGHVASNVAVSAVADYLCNVMPWADSATRAKTDFSSDTLPGVRRNLATALAKGDQEVRRAAVDVGTKRPMGTTTTMAYILGRNMYVAHAGDSRCYLLREGRLRQLTTDHTLAEQLRDQADFVVDEDSPWHDVLWNALGASESSVVQPEVRRCLLRTFDTVLLCSDGLTKHVSNETITKILQQAASASDACRQLVNLANDGGGTDNTTVVVVRCLHAPGPQDVYDEPTLVKEH